MSFDAIEKYNTRLLITKKTIMFATVALLSNGRQKDETKEHVQRESPLTSCVLFLLPGPIFIRKICFRLCTCVAGVRNIKNLLLINQKIYVHGCVFVRYHYRGILYCNALPAFSLRDASCNVIDIEIICRTFQKRDCSFVSDL